MIIMAARAFDLQLKILLIGDMAVGKTCLLRRFVDNEFSPAFVTTIGIDYKLKQCQVGEKKVVLQVWDTAGQERFRTITHSYFRGSNAIMLVFDLTNAKSFKSIENWASSISERTHDDSIVKVIIGNKIDAEEKVVSEDQVKALAKKLGMPYFLVSAKQGLHVDEAFNFAAQQCVERLKAIAPELATSGGGDSSKVDLANANSASGSDESSCCGR